MAKKWKTLSRLCIAHGGYIAYYCVLFWKLYDVLKNTEWKEANTLITAILLCLVIGVLQVIIAYKTYKSRFV